MSESRLIHGNPALNHGGLQGDDGNARKLQTSKINIQYLEKIGRIGPMGRMDWRAGGWIEFRITRQADVLRVTDPRAGELAGARLPLDFQGLICFDLG